MAQHVILNHPNVTFAGAQERREPTEWSARTKLACVLACTVASWAIVVAPFFLIG